MRLPAHCSAWALAVTVPSQLSRAGGGKFQGFFVTWEDTKVMCMGSSLKIGLQSLDGKSGWKMSPKIWSGQFVI